LIGVQTIATVVLNQTTFTGLGSTSNPLSFLISATLYDASNATVDNNLTIYLLFNKTTEVRTIING